MATMFAPPGGTVTVSDLPYVVTYSLTRTNLTPAGVAAMTAQITGYLTGPKLLAIANEAARFGTSFVPASVITTSSGSFPVLAADAQTQINAIVAVIAAAGNVF